MATRYRNFATVVYPDSAPEDWLERLGSQKVPVMVSPLHDQDLDPNPEGGEPKQKKPHYHVLYAFEGVKTEEQIATLIKDIGGVGCEIVKSLRGYARYLCHLDNPDKHQYNEKDIRQFGGVDYFGITELAIDRVKAIGEMKEFCEQYDIYSFYLLDRYAQCYRPDWARVLITSSTLHMKEWLMSRKWSRDNNMFAIIDPATGEVAFDLGGGSNG